MDIGLPSRLAEWQWGYPRLPTSSHFLNAPLEEPSKGAPGKFWLWLVRFFQLRCLWMLLLSTQYSVVHMEFQLWRLPVLWIRFYPNTKALFGYVGVGGVTLLLTIITEGPSALVPANFQATSRFTYLKKHWCSIFNSIYIFTWPLHQYSKYQIVHISPHQSKHPIINKFQVRGFGDHLTKLWDHQRVIKSAKAIKTVRYSLIN